MDLKKAAENVLLLWNKNTVPIAITAKQTETGDSKGHILFMLNELMEGKIEGEKGHRWLGYIQGWMVAEGHLTLTDCKYCCALA